MSHKTSVSPKTPRGYPQREFAMIFASTFVAFLPSTMKHVQIDPEPTTDSHGVGQGEGQ